MSENLPRLHYLTSDNKAELLPEWAYFFMRLGYQLATIPDDNYRIVIGLALPTRVFACSLVATGIVLARAGIENSDNATQLQYIRSLEPGTSVYLRTNDNRKLPGIIERFQEINGEEWIFIRTGKRETLPCLLKRFASRITVVDRDVSLPEYSRSGYSLETPGKFLTYCLGEELAQKYVLNSSFVALLIGKKSVIEHEVSGVSFSCNVPDKSVGVSGHLQDILRVRQFSGANKSYHTQCISSSNITLEEEIGTPSPPIVLFDGAIAYIKLSHKWHSAHQIVLLDRAERQFDEASGLLNQNYAYRLAGTLKFPMKIPDGIEMMVYKESI